MSTWTGIPNTDIKFSELRSTFKSDQSGQVSLSNFYRSTTEIGWSDPEPNSETTQVYVRPFNTGVPTSGTISFSDFKGAWDGREISKVYIHIVRGNSLDTIYLAINGRIATHNYVRLTDFDSITDWTLTYGGTTFTLDPDEIIDTTDRIYAPSNIALQTGPNTTEYFTIIPFSTKQDTGLTYNTTTVSLVGWDYPWDSLAIRPRIGFFTTSS